MAKRAIKQIRSTKRSWAIETGLAGRPYLISASSKFPAFYPSRRIARETLGPLKSGYVLPFAARAVRVAIVVTTIGRG